MSKKERDLILKQMDRKSKEVLSSKESTLKFLIKAGLVTVKGNLKAPYK